MRIVLAALALFLWLALDTTTVAPACAKHSAMAAPMPDPAPVVKRCRYAQKATTPLDHRPAASTRMSGSKERSSEKASSPDPAVWTA